MEVQASLDLIVGAVTGSQLRGGGPWPLLRGSAGQPVDGLDRANALDDACSEPFSSINGESGSDDIWVWLPCLMITGQANRQSFKSSLAGSPHSVGACDMPDHQKLTTRAKHTVHLVDCCCGVRDAAEG
jgi:hypothetical protein